MTNTTTATETSATFQIPNRNVPEFTHAVSSLSRRAERLGMAPIVATRTGSSHREVADTVNPNLVRGYLSCTDFLVTNIDVELRLKGWKLIAALTHEPGGNIVRSLSLEELHPKYRTAGPDCDHCKAKRTRNETFVVRHTDGREAQIGSTCLDDFTSMDSALLIAGLLADIWETKARYSMEDESEGFGGGPPDAVKLVDYLAHVSFVVRRDGYISRKAGESAGYWTARGASESMAAFAVKEQQIVVPTADDLAVAKRAIAWAKASKQNSDYAHNLRVIAGSEMVEPRNFGFAASMVPGVQRADAEALARASSGPGAHVGTVGKRELFTVIVMRTVAIDSQQWGSKNLHIMVDEAGNDLVWNASCAPLTVGTKVTIKATVKKHEMREGRPQTVLSRCAVEQIHGAEKCAGERAP